MSPKPYRGAGAAVAVARWLIAAAALCAAGAQAQFLDAPTQQKIRAATLEVVMLKPDEPNVTYEKPLPLDLEPYQFRTDKYFPAGTAFYIGNHRFVTAAHVLGLGVNTLWGTPAVRDGSGKVYAIDQVLKYSTAQDFAVFSLADEPAVAPLEIGPHPALNEAVYAVGNALGEGVVIRDGQYTSDTPEERDGKWKWLRFSAAASPGNSGGPLLDQSGKVIGVVLRKSPNENLNYALSIDDLLAAKDNTALIDNRETYSLDVFEFKQTETIRKEFALPKSFAAFSKAYLEIVEAFEDQLLHDLLSNNAADIFPRGAGATELLHSIQNGDAPGLVTQEQSGRWAVRRPAQGSRAELGHNGFVSYAHFAGNPYLPLTIARMRRPDDVPAAQFYGDSRLFMDTLIKGLPMRRTVGPESVKMSSLGKAEQDQVFVDSYQRKWQLRQWRVPYENFVVSSLALPVPEGYAILVRATPSARTHESVNDLKALADFIDVPYGGTLAQWQEFRKQSALLPAALQPIELQVDYGKSLRYASPRLTFSYTPSLQKITPDSELYLDFSYFTDHDRAVWDVARIKANEDAHNNSYVSIARNIEPVASMPDDFRSRWAKIAHRQHPYDAVLVNEGDFSAIHTVHQPAAGQGGDGEAVLYTVMVQNDGIATQEAMQAKLDQAVQGLSISDDQAPKANTGEAQD